MPTAVGLPSAVGFLFLCWKPIKKVLVFHGELWYNLKKEGVVEHDKNNQNSN